MSVVTVDDRSSRIAYSGFWVQALDRGVTINGAWDPGSQARFSFKGVRVSVFGVVPDGNGEVVRVDFQIDGGTPVTQKRQSGSQRVFNELWWQSDTLSNTDHTLVMTYQRVNNANVDFRLDFIEYTTAPDSTPSTPPPTPQTTTVTTGAQPTSTPATNTQSTSALTPDSQPASRASTSGTQPTSALTTATQSSNTPTNGTVTQAGTNIYIIGTQSTQQSATAISNGPSEESPATSSKSQTPVGAIIGGSLGSMLVIVLAALAFLLLKRRRRRAAEPKLEIEPPPMAPYAILSRGFSPAPSSNKSQTSQNVHVPPAALSSVSVSGTTFSTSDSGAGLSYQTGPASDHVNDHPSDLPPPAYDAHLRV